MSFSIKYGITVFTNKIAEMAEPFCRKLSVNKNFNRKKIFAETMVETAFKSRFQTTIFYETLNVKLFFYSQSKLILCIK